MESLIKPQRSGQVGKKLSYCPHCDYHVDMNDNFCGGCGRRVEVSFRIAACEQCQMMCYVSGNRKLFCETCGTVLLPATQCNLLTRVAEYHILCRMMEDYPSHSTPSRI